MQITDIRGILPRSGTYMKRPMNAITKIAVHWDAMNRPHEYDSVARYVGEAQMHINKDWGGGAHGDGLMYHLKIDNVGEVFQCRNYDEVLWNVGGNPNYYTLAVCLDGTTGQNPTKEQAESFEKLMAHLCYEHPEFPATQGDVMGHREWVPTECPGLRNLQMVHEYNANGKVNTSDLVYDYQPTPTPEPPVVVPPAKPPVAPPTPPVVVEPPVPTTPTPPIEDTPSLKKDSWTDLIPGLKQLIDLLLTLLGKK